MPWGMFGIGLFVVFLLQATIVRGLGAPYLDLYLAYALFLGLVLPAVDARLAALLVGLAQDLGGADPLGLHAFMLGLAAVILTRLRPLVNLSVWWVRLGVCTLAALPPLLLEFLHARWWRGAPAPTWTGFLGIALATALLAGGLVAALTVQRRLRWRTSDRYAAMWR